MTSKTTTSGVVKKGMRYTLLFAAVSFGSLLSMSSSASAQVSDQGSGTNNNGQAAANSGGNTSGGNGSGNNAASGQNANAAGSGANGAVGNNGGSTGNNSNGSGNVATGNASAVGNKSGTGTNQTVVSGVNGSVVIVDQNSSVNNQGVGVANTGGNNAVGNNSNNASTNNQAAAANGVGVSDAVANNNGTASNNSNGYAGISTGDAHAVGNDSTTNTNQVANANATGGLGGIVIIDQSADINNQGVGIANTGGNQATGNNSVNDANSDQTATATGSISNNSALTSNHSDGTANVETGDANATGNQATNNVSQIANGTAGGTLGGIVIIDQSANVNNEGVAVANTGLNAAVGNNSDNRSNAVQGAVSGAGPPADDSVASNNAETSNWSNGSAGINTGAATATGNSSNTNITQTANGSTGGGLGGLVLVDQEADVNNAGVAIANTGGNNAVGNASDNDADADQTADASTGTADTSVAANFGVASNSSDGSAEITTGNATATGNASTTNIAQVTNVETNGLALVDQDADVTNAGIAVANTGGNQATGNASDNDADNTQTAVSAAGTDQSVAANFGEALNHSNGSADITTGNANAIGNDGAATTNVAQVANVNGSGLTLADQDVDVANEGAGLANTGLNLAAGNVSDNDADSIQTATPGSGAETTVAANFGSTANHSDGSASITTGAANGVGNRSTTNVAQVLDVNGEGLVLSDQEADVTNEGIGAANTGLNLAAGNASDNDAFNNQDADTNDNTADDVVAANFAAVENHSDGSADIHTGAANGIGNDSAATTNIAQTADANIDGSGFVLVDQDADVTNAGLGIANSGVNAAVGNASANTANNTQNAFVTESGPGDLDADDVVASNNAETSNWSNGSAEVTTGTATATGNASTTNIAQASDSNINGNGFALVDQEADVDNDGFAVANTGVNAAIGNISDNGATNDQVARVTESGPGDLDAEDVVASNNAVTSNTSDGHGHVHTGAATATGNHTNDSIAQVADANIDGSGFVLVDQEADVDNFGIGGANSGVNAAVGNASDNDVENDQRARVRETGPGDLEADDVVASNVVEATNSSNGTGEVVTGNATGTGNHSNTDITQASDSNIGGNGFVLVDSAFDVDNTGVGVGNSGINAAIGNNSINDIDDPQAATVRESGPGSVDAEDVVASNIATSSNNSDGTGSVSTGDASGIGNHSSTTGTQVADASIAGNGFVLADQDADVDNEGLGIGNSGLNLAVGNASDNDSDNDQIAVVRESGPGDLDADDVVASNVSSTTNDSDGTASITTGVGHGVGNQTTDTITQGLDANINGNGFVLSDQVADVDNAGVAIGNSGLNLAAGNVSDNGADNDQTAIVRESGPGDLDAEDVVASNVGDTANRSNGSATIRTGCACAVGNNSLTNITQLSDANLDGTGFALVDQDADIENAGLGIANSGLNQGVGNSSVNDADSDQVARVRQTGAGSLTGEDVVANNVGGSVNDSDGTVDIVTGNVTGIGNWSATGVVQAASVPDDGLNLVDQDATLVNVGLGVASSGLNLAAGNASVNNVANAQLATADGGTGDVVANNVSAAANNSNGSSSILTGNAYAVGNMATNQVCQGINTSPNCAPVTLPPLPDCGCPRAVTPPPGPGPIPGPGPGAGPQPKPAVGAPGLSGQALPRTGSGVAAQAMLGLLLVAMGSLLRRRARTA